MLFEQQHQHQHQRSQPISTGAAAVVAAYRRRRIDRLERAQRNREQQSKQPAAMAADQMKLNSNNNTEPANHDSHYSLLHHPRRHDDNEDALAMQSTTNEVYPTTKMYQQNHRHQSHHHQAHSGETKQKSKRVRTIFTPEQLKRLEQEFSNQMYLVGHYRCLLAQSLNLTEAQVKVWFQNRRIKFRKLNPGPASLHSGSPPSNQTSDNEDYIIY